MFLTYLQTILHLYLTLIFKSEACFYNNSAKCVRVRTIQTWASSTVTLCDVDCSRPHYQCVSLSHCLVALHVLWSWLLLTGWSSLWSLGPVSRSLKVGKMKAGLNTKKLCSTPPCSMCILWSYTCSVGNKWCCPSFLQSTEDKNSVQRSRPPKTCIQSIKLLQILYIRAISAHLTAWRIRPWLGGAFLCWFSIIFLFCVGFLSYY